MVVLLSFLKNGQYHHMKRRIKEEDYWPLAVNVEITEVIDDLADHKIPTKSG